MERIGIFGGSFHPPHKGHMQTATGAISALGLTKLLMIPAAQPPHKNGVSFPLAEQRMEMLRIAASAEPRIEISDLELRREGSSYSCDTVNQLRMQYPDAELVLILGSDMFLCFPEWKNAEEIARNVSLAVFYRGEKGEREKVNLLKQTLQARNVRVTVLGQEPCPISSTQLRRLLAFGCDREFLPEGVAEYIRQQGLYDTNADWRHLPMEQLEPIVVRLLNPNRVRHVLGCRDTAVELARRWGANEEDAARAGILHDITKALDGPLQLTLCRAYGKILDDFSQKYPKTLHALTGSLVAERIFGENEAVVSAICWHTTGKADMNLLESIIYVADYMEPNRDFPGVERLRELAFTDIRAALKLGLEMTLEHLKRQGNEVSPGSREALEFLNR